MVVRVIVPAVRQTYAHTLVQGGILITGKKLIHSNVVASKPGSYCVSESAGANKMP